MESANQFFFRFFLLLSLGMTLNYTKMKEKKLITDGGQNRDDEILKIAFYCLIFNQPFQFD